MKSELNLIMVHALRHISTSECHDKNEKDQDNHHTSEERTRGLFDKNEKDQYNEKDQ